MIRFLVLLSRLCAICLLSLVLWTISAQAQSSPSEKGQGCVDNIVGVGAPGYQGHKILSVKIKVRYLSVPVPPPGTPYSPETVTKLVEDVDKALKNERNREDVEGATEFKVLQAVSIGKGEMEGTTGSGPIVKFSAITSCVKPIERTTCQSALGQDNPNCVEITIRAISVRLDSNNVWSSILPLPRSNKPTILSEVPGPLLALNPKFGADYDRKFGAAETFAMSSNLLDLPQTLRSQPVKVSKTRLDLAAFGRKSQSEDFYNANTNLSWSRSLAGPFEKIAAETSFVADHMPLAEGDYLRNLFSAGASMRVQAGLGLLDKLTIGAAYRWSSNRFFFPGAPPSERASENGFQGRILADGHLGNAVTRLALWADVGSPDKGRDGYNRFAGILAIQKEVPIKPNQTIGFEAILGAGRARGDVPQYARFYGGNVQRNFLYEPADSPTLTAFPTGPLLRSFGSGQASAGATTSTPSGGTSYWHFNLNASIPIPAWSQPLVPDIVIEGIPKRDANGKVVLDENGEPVTESRPVRDLLKSQGESSRKVLQRIFVKQGLSQQEAAAKAARELKGVNSLLRFVADQANIFSVKPLFMFDAARIGAPGAINNQARYALGGGLQLTIVVAKFEAGYLRTVHRINGDPRGNFVMRLVFQNLF